VKSASSSLPDQPVNGVTAGVDWAWEDHAVSVVDDHGREIGRRRIEHTAVGMADLLGLLRRYQVEEVAIERCDGPVVETLLEAGITVVVISPNQVKNLRGRYGSAGHKDDRFDAFVLADTLRTDRARLVPLTRDSDATIELRRTCRARKDLIAHRVAATNQLRAHLQNAFPGALGLFSDFAGDSRRSNPWAADLYQRARARGDDHPHARRILARAWLFVIWHCWQDRTAYDPNRHQALQRLLNQDHQAAA
jgi:hypothetical protein